MHIFKRSSKQKTKETQHLAPGTAAEDAETNQVGEWQPLQVSPLAPRMSQNRAQSHAETRVSQPLKVENHCQMKLGNICLKRDFSQAC